MAFAGTFISQIEKVFHGKSNLAATHKQTPPSLQAKISSRLDSRTSVDNSNEYTAANYPGVLATDLTSLTAAQRHIFIVILAILFMLSMCGNMCTLFVNFRRQLRPFFRACLISLALSDLMNTVFLATSYFSQFTADFVQIWSLGEVMCSLVPFATTCAILASSMTLVGIALDRYFAVMKVVIGFWPPSVISCIACMLCIWLAAISISCPVYTFYDLIPVYVLTEEQETTVTAPGGPTTITTETEVTVINTSASNPSLITKNGFVVMTSKKLTTEMTDNLTSTIKSLLTAEPTAKLSSDVRESQEDLSFSLLRKQNLVNMCVSDQKNVSAYYVLVFAIIFVPCIVAFFWFNSVIARKLWKRRHFAAITKQRNLKSNNISKPVHMETTKAEQPKCAKSCTCKSIQTSSATLSSSLANTLCGQVNTAAAKGETTSNKSNVAANNNREARHLRMFIIILLMMAVFVFLRLPAWIFLLMRMYGNYSQPSCWILYFTFGLMNLGSSVLNPLFYTFLIETIQYALRCKSKVTSVFCGCHYRAKYGSSTNKAAASVASANNNKDECPSDLTMNNVKESCFKTTTCYKIFCGCNGQKSAHEYNIRAHSLQYASETRAKDDAGPAINNDKDEGVDCNDEMDEQDVASFYEYNQRIFTIFPPSLVSSSINSDNS